MVNLLEAELEPLEIDRARMVSNCGRYAKFLF